MTWMVQTFRLSSVHVAKPPSRARITVPAAAADDEEMKRKKVEGVTVLKQISFVFRCAWA